jgi:hypothetical protein
MTNVKSFCSSTAGLITFGALLIIAVLVAFVLGGDWAGGLIGSAILVAYLAVIAIGRRRSDTLSVMSGLGDERSRHLYMRACAFAGTVMAFVIPGWWLVTVAEGKPNPTLNVLGSIFGVSFIAASIVLARRS